MASNHSKMLAMYELSTFLAQINVYRGQALSESHEVSTFLSLYSGKSWTRCTGKYHFKLAGSLLKSLLQPVSRDANFDMERTALTVGGFTQPVTAQGLIELPTSIEKGLTQRFLWLCPRPSYSKLESLELVNEEFVTFLGELIL